MPVKQRCGAPGYTCATGSVEPPGVYLVESVTGSNIGVYYESGEERVKALKTPVGPSATRDAEL